MKAGVVVVAVLFGAGVALAEPDAFKANISYDQAIQTALSHAGGCRVAEVDLDNDNGLVWEVDVITNDGIYEVDVDAMEGCVLDSHREFYLWPFSSEPKLDEGNITIEQAIQTALDCAGGCAKIDEAEYQHYKGRAVFDIDTMTADGIKTEVRVDVQTGEIV